MSDSTSAPASGKQLDKAQQLDISKGWQNRNEFGKIVAIFGGVYFLCSHEWESDADATVYY